MIDTLRERLARLREQVDALSVNERLLVLGAVLLVLYVLWQSLLIDPLINERAQLGREATRLETNIRELEVQAADILAAAKADPDAKLRQQIAATESQIAKFEAEIRERAGQLLTPADMPKVLESVLKRFRGLDFVSLQGLGAQPLLEDGAGGKRAGKGVTKDAYRHGFRVNYRGGYLDTIEYLQALEQLPWRFFWDGVEFEVTKHPQAKVSIIVYTLSLDRRWIGV